MAYLYKVKSIVDFEEYYKIKADKAAILWSGFATVPDKDKLKDHFLHLLSNNDIYLYYLKDDQTNDVIGYDQMIKIDKDTVESAGHSIKIEYQGKGFGNLMIRLITQQANELGFKRIIAWVSEHNISSIKNFENCGFIKTLKPYRTTALKALGREDRFFMWEKVL